MKILNLVDIDKSDIKYQHQEFPDGQQNIVINKQDCYGAKYNYLLMSHEDCQVTIKSRLNNWLDLELIICSVVSLRELGVKEIHLYTPYIMGARSDRKFEDGGNNYLKDVICPIINSLNFKTVTCIDPHSDVLEACINNFRKEDNSQLVKYAIMNASLDPKNCILVSPDAGASKKIYKLAEQIGYKGDIITCSKERDKDGKLTQVYVPLLSKHVSGGDFIIIDDLIDGGQTFINIVKEIKKCFIEGGYETMIPKFYLIVTHGIFSKGFEELSQYFDGIYCTNSYKQFSEYELIKIDRLAKQLNVF